MCVCVYIYIYTIFPFLIYTFLEISIVLDLPKKTLFQIIFHNSY